MSNLRKLVEEMQNFTQLKRSTVFYSTCPYYIFVKFYGTCTKSQSFNVSEFSVEYLRKLKVKSGKDVFGKSSKSFLTFAMKWVCFILHQISGLSRQFLLYV